MGKPPKGTRARVRARAERFAGEVLDAARRLFGRRWTPALATVRRRRR